MSRGMVVWGERPGTESGRLRRNPLVFGLPLFYLLHRRANAMNDDQRRPEEPSREGSRVWLLIVACSAIGLLFAGIAVSKSLDRSARFITREGHHHS
jgi:hypothetical protein